MLSLPDEEIESYNNQQFCYICKKKFYDIDDSDNSGDDNDDDDDKFDTRKFYGDVAGTDIVVDDYNDGFDDGDDEEFDARKSHGDAAEADIDIDNYMMMMGNSMV